MLIGNNPYPQDPRVRREALALRDAGYDVAVVCRSVRGQPQRETVDGVRVYRYPRPLRPRGLLTFAFHYAYSTLAALALSVQAFRERPFDVVHAHNPPDTLALVGGLYKLLGRRFVYDHHDLAPEMYAARSSGAGNPLVYKALVLLEKLSCRFADHVIATNESYRAMELERGNVAPERITVVRNGPGIESISSVDPDAELRARAGTLIGFLGVMGYQDGVDHLLRAVHHLVHDLGRKDTLCVLIGTGDARPDLQNLARELGIQDHTWFTGFIPMRDVLRYLATVDVCVDPDPSTPFSDRSTMIKMMDYMAVGKPIVAFDLPENRFTAGEAALYVPPDEDLELARGIAALMDDPERRLRMGAFGRRRIETTLAWAKSVPNLLEAYRAVTNVAPARARALRGRRRGPAALGARSAGSDRRTAGL